MQDQPRKHVVITGTGRAGTSFLVQLLTHLRLDTGFTPESMRLDENAKAGLEWDIRQDNAPRIVKSPYFCDYAAEVIQRADIVIEHVFVPFRDLHAAAESRRSVVKNAVAKLPWLERLKGNIKPPHVPGGLFNTKSKRGQENVLLMEIHSLMLALAPTHIPITLLHYPTLVRDSDYLYTKLKPILGSISREQFNLAFKQAVRPEWVHSFSPSESSQSK